MDYFDDILNIYAYLRMKQSKSLEEIEKIAGTYGKLEELSGILEGELSGSLRRAYSLAEKLGVGLEPFEQKEAEPHNVKPSLVDEKIVLPDNFDIETEFARLVMEARAAGFTNVQPEELLTQEELAHALAFEARLDAEFKEKTSLTKKDIGIFILAVMFQILRFYILKLVESNKAYKTEAISFDSDSPIRFLLGSGRPMKNYKFILNDSIPFLINDIPDSLKGDEVLGKDKYLGWILGVMNILTDSVTFRSMKSYGVIRPGGNSKAIPDTEISTIKDVLLPVINFNGSESDRKSVIAAVMRQALVLIPSDMEFDDASAQVQRTMKIIDKLDIAGHFFKSGVLSKYMSQAGLAGLINTIITAIHCISYKERTDGDIACYAMRTNKIIVYSGAVAALCNSVPAIISKDISNMDLGGVVAAVVKAIGSVRFRINIKAEFLASHYIEAINEELEKVNAYFE